MWVQLRRYVPNPLTFRSHNFSKYSVHYNNYEGHDVQLLSLGHISTSVGTWDLGPLIALFPLGYKSGSILIPEASILNRFISLHVTLARRQINAFTDF